MATKPEVKFGKIQRVPEETPKRSQPDEYTPVRKRIPKSNMPQPRARRKEDNSA